VRIDLPRNELEPLDFHVEVVVPAERLDPDQVAGPIRSRLKGSVRSHGDGFLVEGRIEAEGELVCVRCLDPVPWQGSEEFRVELSPSIAPPGGDEDLELDDSELDRVLLEDDQLDLDDLAAEQVMLALPMRALCRETCAGLCPSCGANRNRPDACSCEPEGDPRWEALRGLSGLPS
jgi:uncharacterized protein